MTIHSADADNPSVTLPLRMGLDVRMAQASGIGTYVRALRDQYRGRTDIELREVDSNAPIYSIREQVALPPRARGLDLFHAPHYNAPLAVPCPLVVTVHDLAHLVLPHLFPEVLARAYANGMFHAVVARAQHVITGSEYTKGEIHDHLGVDLERITVIHHGIDPRFTHGPSRQDRQRVHALGIHGDFVLYVGNIKSNKNVLALIEAFGQLGKGSEQLVLAGRHDRFRYGLGGFAQALATSPAQDRIVATGELPFEDILALYRCATVFVLPSIYEGFGLPVLEAMACGTAVIASDRTSIPEVAGDAALLVDATAPSQLAGALRRLLDDAALRRTLVERGLVRARQFSWARSAKSHLEVYRRVARATR